MFGSQNLEARDPSSDDPEAELSTEIEAEAIERLADLCRDIDRSPENPTRATRPLLHGAHSPAQIGRVARTQKRRLLRQIGLRGSDLGGVGLALVDNWARAQGKVELLDEHFAVVGLLDEAGEPRSATKIYFTALNSARLAAIRLAEHLKERSVADPSMVLVLQGQSARVADGRRP